MISPDRLFAEHAGLREAPAPRLRSEMALETRVKAYSSCRIVSDTEANASRKAVVCEASWDSGANPNSTVGLCSPRWSPFHQDQLIPTRRYAYTGDV